MNRDYKMVLNDFVLTRLDSIFLCSNDCYDRYIFRIIIGHIVFENIDELGLEHKTLGEIFDFLLKPIRYNMNVITEHILYRGIQKLDDFDYILNEFCKEKNTDKDTVIGTVMKELRGYLT